MEKEAERFEAIIYIKVGTHAGETIDEIISRKQGEEKRAGLFFWGHGSGMLNPSTRVIPFVEESRHRGIMPKVLMHIMYRNSGKNYSSNSHIAQYYSIDNKNWKPIPKGILVTGSKYALVCKNLRKVETFIDLGMYKVANGKGKGMLLNSYIRYRVDRACAFLKDPLPEDLARSDTTVEISYVTDLVEPYAVFLKGG